MDSIAKPRAKTLLELMPDLRGTGLINYNENQAYTKRKQPNPAPTDNRPRTAEKCLKPMPIAELRMCLSEFKSTKSPPRVAIGAASNKRKWNSSVKVDKKLVSHTANGQMKHNPVRKALDFQAPKAKPPKSTFASRMTMINSQTPKLQKSNPVHNPVRISGIYAMPSSSIKPTNFLQLKKRMTLANKENLSSQANIEKKITTTPKSSARKRILASRIPDTPLSNESWKSSCDASFLQNEKDIENNEGLKQKTLDKEMPLGSTPYRQYRNENDFFNSADNSEECQDDTIMSFDNPNPKSSDTNVREESVIVSLCDMLQKTNVNSSDTEKVSSELDLLLALEKQHENNVTSHENSIKALKLSMECELKSLTLVRKLIKEKTMPNFNKDVSKNIPEVKVTPEKMTVGKPCSVIKSCLKSPSYKIPKKNTSCLRKKVYYKSMPNVTILSPVKDMNGKAYKMYMEMKGHMNFLSTPASKHQTREPNTPAITSHNLQQQLDKLYES